MDFEVPPETVDFAREVAEVLKEPETVRLLQDVRARRDGIDGDVRELYRHLGRAGILAPSWPVEYGGRALDFTATVALLELLVAHHVPQNLHCISVLDVGSLILAAGTDHQRKTLLPALASGELAACILFTEPEHGSDLAGLTTRAVRDSAGTGWVVDGRKTYSLKSAHADLGLCAVRTDRGNRYEGISLFLVPLRTSGVTVRSVPSIADEQFHDVWFTDVPVEEEALVGKVGAGWSLINQLFAAECASLDHYARGKCWLDLVADRLTGNGRQPDELVRAGLAQHRTRLAASRLLTSRAMQNLQENKSDLAASALAKWHASETAKRIAWWALDTLGPHLLEPGTDSGDRVLEAAYREAPGLTVSGGASEVMLDIVSSARLFDDARTEG